MSSPAAEADADEVQRSSTASHTVLETQLRSSDLSLRAPSDAEPAASNAASLTLPKSLLPLSAELFSAADQHVVLQGQQPSVVDPAESTDIDRIRRPNA